MRLRDWAGAAWIRPGVAAACLTLQDDHGQCVPLLLWALWLADQGQVADDATIGRGVDLCRLANASVIEPLRAARRNAASAERDRFLAEELHAEHVLLDQLEALPVPARSGTIDRRTLLTALSRRWGHHLAPQAFEDIVRAFSAPEPADVR